MEHEEIEKLLADLTNSNDALRASEERYHRMISEIEDYAIILLDPMGRIEKWNKGAQLIKGYSESEVIGRSFHIFYPEDDVKTQLPEKLLQEARTKGKVSHEGWRVRKNGSRFWGSVVITALHNVRNEIVGFSKVTRDLTERKLLEDSLRTSTEELRHNNERLERLNEQLRSFTYVASHDMKEPLRKIHTYAALIRDNGFDRDKSEMWLAKIISSTEGMQHLIADLLSLSEVSEQPRAFETVDLNAVFARVLSSLELQITEKKAVINTVDLPVIAGHEIQLEQLFLNLLSNAIKFSKPAEAPVIDIRCEIVVEKTGRYERRCYHITVRDNGVGFKAENPEVVFEPFKRLHSRQAFPGTGIGLAIAKRVMENHHGRISVDSVLDKGTVFHLYFPVESPRPPRIMIDQGLPAALVYTALLDLLM